MQLKTPKPIIFIFLTFSLFPYIKLLPVVSDIQPNALVVGFLIIGLNWLRAIVRNVAVVCYGVAAVALCFIPIDTYYYDSYSIVRGLGSAASFVVCVLAWNEIERCTLEKFVTNNFITLILLVYVTGGIAQLYISPDVLTPILSRPYGYGGVGGRGVESFTAEPTYLAIQIVLVMWFGSVLAKGSLNRINVSLGCLIIVFVSRSSSVIISGLIGLGVLLFSFIRSESLARRGVVFLVMPIFVLVAVILNYIISGNVIQSEVRILRLIDGLLNDGLTGLSINDFSTADRLKHIEVSFKLSIQDWLVPHGYGDFYAPYNNFQSKYLVYDRVYLTFNDRIMSGYGGALFEFGWFGLVPILLISRNLMTLQSNSRGFWFVTISLLLIQSVPLSNPMVAFLASKHNGLIKRDN